MTQFDPTIHNTASNLSFEDVVQDDWKYCRWVLDHHGPKSTEGMKKFAFYLTLRSQAIADR